jgi:dihydroxyacid dehydratase/phosphogluconate dehydratase
MQPANSLPGHQFQLNILALLVSGGPMDTGKTHGAEMGNNPRGFFLFHLTDLLAQKA